MNMMGLVFPIFSWKKLQLNQDWILDKESDGTEAMERPKEVMKCTAGCHQPPGGICAFSVVFW